MRGAKLGIWAGAAAVASGWAWWRYNPSACPYGQRFWIEAPHPLISRTRLREILEPQPGERVLEVGPGTGYYAVDMGERLGREGRLDVLDVQQEMLDHTIAQAAKRGVANLVAAGGDARDMPYEDATFDAAYLATVLGEIPDQDAALRELRRVLRPQGRLVVGELMGDPHMVRLGPLRERGERAALRFERRLGSPLGYFARFAPV